MLRPANSQRDGTNWANNSAASAANGRSPISSTMISGSDSVQPRVPVCPPALVHGCYGHRHGIVGRSLERRVGGSLRSVEACLRIVIGWNALADGTRELSACRRRYPGPWTLFICRVPAYVISVGNGWMDEVNDMSGVIIDVERLAGAVPEESLCELEPWQWESRRPDEDWGGWIGMDWGDWGC